MKNLYVIWFFRLVAAVILLQTLYFKFSGAPESVYIFSALGVEPYGRIGSGILELFASVLILIPRTTWYGAVIGLTIMFGAVVSHLFVLGIEIQNDGGELFALAIIVLVSCVAMLYLEKDKFLNFYKTK